MTCLRIVSITRFIIVVGWRRRRRWVDIRVLGHELISSKSVLDIDVSEIFHDSRIITTVIHKASHFIVEYLVPFDQIQVPRMLVLVHSCMLIMPLFMLLVPFTLLVMPTSRFFMSRIIGNLHLLKHGSEISRSFRGRACSSSDSSMRLCSFRGLSWHSSIKLVISL